MRLVALVLLPLLTAACAMDAEHGSSGVRGQVFAGPQCPVEQAGSPCPDLPFDGVVIASTDGDEVARTETDVEGRFQLAVDPGTYTLVAAGESGQPPLGEPQDVIVPDDTFVAITLAVDTGIR